MGTFKESLKKWFYNTGTSAGELSSRIPVLDGAGNPIGSNTVQNIANVMLQGIENRLSALEELAEISVTPSETVDIENNPSGITSGSEKIPTANAVSGALDAVKASMDDGVYDVSAKNSGAVFDSLQALLSSQNIDTLIPVASRNGGMSIKFILRTNTGTEESPVYKDEYVQYRLMRTDWSTNVTDWQGVDKKPTPGSRNFVESWGVKEAINSATLIECNDVTSEAGTWVNRNSTDSATFELDDSGHNGIWHLLKKAIQSSAIRMDLSSLENGKIYNVRFNALYEGDSILSSIMTAETIKSVGIQVTDAFSGEAVYLKNGLNEINLLKGLSWNYLYIQYGNIDILTYPLDVTISNFTIKEVAEIKDVVHKCVSVEQQSFTENQKQQARQNLGFGNGNIDTSITLGSDNLITDHAVAKKIGGVIAEATGISSTSETVTYIQQNTLSFPLPAGTKIYINVDGVGDNNSDAVSKLRLYLTKSSSPIYIKQSQVVELAEDATRLLVRSVANETKFAGTVKVSVSIYGIGEEVGSLQEKVASLSESAQNISVLFIGNSLTADVVAYLPLLLGEKKLRFTICNWYIGGAGMAEHLRRMEEDEKCEIFSIWKNGEDHWTRDTVHSTMQDILSMYNFDVVCLQDMFNTYSSIDNWNINDFKGVISYIKTNSRVPLDFVGLLPASKRNTLSTLNTVYSITTEAYKRIIKETEVKKVIPAGIAIKNAINNNLISSLGEGPNFSYDGVHAQEGLQCMLQTYVLVQWLYDEYGLSYGIQGSKVRVTDISGLNIPNHHGNPVGMDSEEYCNIAQQLATDAYKEGRIIEYNCNIDNTPVFGSDNLIDSNAVYNATHTNVNVNTQYIDESNLIISNSGLWGKTKSARRQKTINVSPGRKYILRSEYATRYTVLKTYNPVHDELADFATGYTIMSIPANTNVEITIPVDGNFLYFVSYEHYSTGWADTHFTVSLLFDLHEVALLIQDIDDNTEEQYFTIDNIAEFSSEDDASKFTESFSFYVKKGSQYAKNMIVTACAHYEQDTGVTDVPTIQLSYVSGGSDTVRYRSTLYIIGNSDYMEEKQWRLPPFMDECKCKITVNIPTGVTLFIQRFENSYSDEINRNIAGYKLNAHFATQNIEKMNVAAKVGYPACVTIPKRTSDGVWVCFHDETIGTQLKDADGHTPAQNHPEIENVGISDLTYSELQNYTFDADYLGIERKVVKLEDFFKLCARTGMNPMLSVHPTPSKTGWEEIKAIAIKYNVLDKLEIKPLANATAIPGVVKEVFGNSIKSVYFQIGDKTAEQGLAYIANYDVDRTKVDVGVTINLVSQPSFSIADARLYIEAGYTVVLYHPNLSEEMFQYWMDNGVYQFTDNSNYSNGLNW